MNTKNDSSSKHTPGPWHVEQSQGNNVAIVDSEEFHILRIRGGVTPTNANARLIAAAPELLERLKDTVVHMQDAIDALMEDVPVGSVVPPVVTELTHQVRFARAAIAKAVGTNADKATSK